MLVYVNGHLVDGERAAISIWDGGFLFGDGVFTTLRLYRGKAVDGPAHHQRLRRQCNLLELPLPLTEKAMVEALEKLAAANGFTTEDARARITISRGGSPDNPLSATALEALEPTVLLTVAPLPSSLLIWQRDGIPVITLGPAFSRGNYPHLKTLNALPMLMALRKAHAAGCPEALLIDRENHLLEGILSNVFLVSRGRLLTPTPEGAILAGRTRDRVISAALHLGLELEEKVLDRSYLKTATEIFMTNSVREIVPVVTVDGQPVGTGQPGPVTRQLQDQYRTDINWALAQKTPAPIPGTGVKNQTKTNS